MTDRRSGLSWDSDKKALLSSIQSPTLRTSRRVGQPQFCGIKSGPATKSDYFGVISFGGSHVMTENLR